MSKYLAALILAPLLLSREAVALEMPSEISNAFVGMTLDALVVARPNLKWMTISGEKKIEPEKLKTGKLLLSESLAPGGDFDGVGYGIVGGKVVSITLVGKPEMGREKERRSRIIKQCVERWGKAYKRRVPEDERRPGNPRPTLTWEIEDVEIALMLPRSRKKGDSKGNDVTLAFRLIANVRKSPWKEMKLSDAENKTLFEDHDAGDKP